MSACSLPSALSNVTSNRLLDFTDSKVREECRVSLAQAVRAFHPGCLPCTLPSKETEAFASQLARSMDRSGYGKLMSSLRALSCWLGSCSNSADGGVSVVFAGRLSGGVEVGIADELFDLAAGWGGYRSPTCASGRLLWLIGVSGMS